MAGNSIGELFRVTTFGESHGNAVGGIIDGCPPNLKIDYNFIDNLLLRRATGKSFFESERKEDDKVMFLSGLSENDMTLGTPLAFYVANKDVADNTYEDLKDIYRPSHADFTYEKKYGIRDYRGGGRASARETVARVVAGAVAMMYLVKNGIHIRTYTSQVGPYKYNEDSYLPDFKKVDKSPLFCPDIELSERMINYLNRMKREKDTTGGVVACVITGVQAGLGEPVFDKLQAELAKSMMSIPSAKGFEYGMGFKSASMKGSEHNDPFVTDIDNKNNTVKYTTSTNNAGGILGGISNGQDIFFKVAFKPPSSIGIPQQTIDNKGNPKSIEIKGKFDVCVIPRVLPVVEAMAAIVIVDHLLRFNSLHTVSNKNK